MIQRERLYKFAVDWKKKEGICRLLQKLWFHERFWGDEEGWYLSECKVIWNIKNFFGLSSLEVCHFPVFLNYETMTIWGCSIVICDECGWLNNGQSYQVLMPRTCKYYRTWEGKTSLEIWLKPLQQRKNCRFSGCHYKRLYETEAEGKFTVRRRKINTEKRGRCEAGGGVRSDVFLQGKEYCQLPEAT